jgi:hypothetical protein
MTVLRTLYHLARADFLERVRRYSFLVLLGVTVYLGYLFVPPVDAAYQTVALGDARGIYNSAWVGAMFGLMISTLVTLIAFYPIKSPVTRDRQTQVGQIIAATPVRKAIYVLGKWLSNVVLLALLLCVMTGMAAVMQGVRGEDLYVDLWALAVPLWLVAFPALCLVAAVAVLFECTPLLCGGVGNVVYFFLFMAVLTLWIASADGDIMRAVNDPFGISYVIADMQQVIKAHDPGYSGEVAIGGSALTAEPLLFRWEGVAWTMRMILGRLSWIGIAALLAIAAALPFDRFDPARSRPRRRAQVREAVPDVVAFPAPDDAPPAPEIGEAAPVVSLTPLCKQRRWPSLGGVLLAEFRLMLQGRRWWWYAVIVGLNAAGLAVPDETVRQYLQAGAWFWPITLWSSMGNRERRHNTEQIVFSVAHPLGRQLSAAWLAGVCVTSATGAGFAAQKVFSGHWSALGAWAVGVLFIPSLALALGTWSGSSRAFEVVYTLLWYIGPMNNVSALDYMGATPQAVADRIWLCYLLVCGVLLGLAVLGRQRQMQQ